MNYLVRLCDVLEKRLPELKETNKRTLLLSVPVEAIPELKKAVLEYLARNGYMRVMK